MADEHCTCGIAKESGPKFEVINCLNGRMIEDMKKENQYLKYIQAGYYREIKDFHKELKHIHERFNHLHGIIQDKNTTKTRKNYYLTAILYVMAVVSFLCLELFK